MISESEQVRWPSSPNQRYPRSRAPIFAGRLSLDAPAGTSARSAATVSRVPIDVPQADLIIAIGAHIDVFSTMFRYGIFSETRTSSITVPRQDRSGSFSP